MQLFDEWAAGYDRAIRDSRGYPFAGYERVHEQIVRDASVHTGTKVLDLGVGTAVSSPAISLFLRQKRESWRAGNGLIGGTRRSTIGQRMRRPWLVREAV